MGKDHVYTEGDLAIEKMLLMVVEQVRNELTSTENGLTIVDGDDRDLKHYRALKVSASKGAEVVVSVSHTQAYSGFGCDHEPVVNVRSSAKWDYNTKKRKYRKRKDGTFNTRLIVNAMVEFALKSISASKKVLEKEGIKKRTIEEYNNEIVDYLEDVPGIDICKAGCGGTRVKLIQGGNFFVQYSENRVDGPIRISLSGLTPQVASSIVALMHGEGLFGEEEEGE